MANAEQALPRTFDLSPRGSRQLFIEDGGGRAQKIFAALLKPEIDFFIFPLPPIGGVSDALRGQGLRTGTGCVRCLIPILLFGGFGYAHL